MFCFYRLRLIFVQLAIDLQFFLFFYVLLPLQPYLIAKKEKKINLRAVANYRMLARISSLKRLLESVQVG